MVNAVAKYQKYAEYKDSGFEWVNELPAHWKAVHLKWISTIYAGGTPSKTIESYWENGTIPWINSGAVNQGYILEPSTYITKTAYENSSAKWIPKKALVMALAGQGKTKGMVAQLGIDTTCNQSMGAIIPDDLDYSRYLFWWITSNYQNIRNMAGGDLRDGLNLEHLGDMSCPLPNKDEIQKIANFLDYETAKIDSLIEKQQKLIELLKEKRQAVISHAVTKGLNPDVPMTDSGVEWLGQVPKHWGRFAVKSLCYINDGNHGEEYPKEADFVEEGEGVPFIRAGDFDDFCITSTNLRYLSHEKNNSMRKGRLRENDVLFVNRGATIGKLCIIDKKYAGSNLNSQIAYLRANKDSVDYRYLTYFLSSVYIQTKIASDIQGGALPQYSIQNIANLDVWFGDLKEQAMIADYLDNQVKSIINLIDKANSAIKLMQERRTALISSAVTGKIDVRNWQNPNHNNEAQTELSL